MTRAMTHIAYFGLIVLLTLSVPAAFVGDPRAARHAIVVIGILGAWRYSWATINFTRAIIFRRFAHPKRKRKAFKRYKESGVVSHAFFMVTSYMVDQDTTLMVYRRLFRAAANAEGGATIVSSVVDGADERLIRQVYATMQEDMSSVKLVIDRIKSNGKRDAMARALRILASFSPTPHDIMIFVDGDTVVPDDVVAQSAPWFSDPNVGALTTHEAAIIEEEGLFKDWFTLRFNQRQVMMCSMGLARNVLTLTGRMSVFRATLATDPNFVQGVGHDYLDHWRLGRVNFLTGDDKSTWYWLLRNGYQMLYLPDVVSRSVETQPRDTFFDSAKTLMVRWFGNMMRTNGRALTLGPKAMGFFTWWSILDQRVSMFTTLVGPISILATAILLTPAVLPLYIGWVLATRYIFCAFIALFNGTWFPVTHPPTLYFSQIVGAAIKTFVLFRLDKQKWTRQNSTGKAAVLAYFDRLKAVESAAHHVATLCWLTIAVLFVMTI
ncbi:glycosyltransferase [Aliiroseovarius sp. YM-037]|uniref:glycosyltransferase n=1 Tax=Aliiroseovarius sp. YM-037 TaxID=3341728 RepID=UPI003A803FF9